MKKIIVPIFLILALITTGVFIFTRQTAELEAKNLTENIEIKDGQQIISLLAKNGYAPKSSGAKADIPTVLKIKTAGTFDCSASLAIPELKYKTILPISGETVIDLGSQPKGKSLRGICSMGMYSFTLNFN